MSVTEILQLKKDEMARRVQAMPQEVAVWRASAQNVLDLNVHFSQLKAIKTLTDAFVAEQQTKLGGLDPNGDASAFQTACIDLARHVVRGQYAWDFFRDKLDLRRSSFKDELWLADTIAWDCHRPVLDQAVLAGVLDPEHFREPPLTYLGAGFSPLTWVRRSRPNDGRKYDLGEATLPIPVIEIPWDFVGNAWEFLSLHHEVGHDIEADLGLRAALREVLGTELGTAHVPNARIATWLKWQGEIFADLCAVQLAGPAFIDALMHLLLLPALQVTTFDDQDPHPTPYLRVLLNTAYARTLVPGHAPLVQHAEQIETHWRTLYAGPAELDAMYTDFAAVFRAIMDTELAVLNGHTVRSLMPYSQADDQRIRAAAGYFKTGMNKPIGLRPRHCVAAARIAVSEAIAAGAVSTAYYNDVQQRLLRVVRDNAPVGLRGGGGGMHDNFVAGFAERIFT